MLRWMLALGLMVCEIGSPVWAQEKTSSEIKAFGLVPHFLLPLVHAAEVQAELKLSKSQVKDLETLFASIDGEWLRSRNLPAEEIDTTTTRLENIVRDWFAKNLSPEQNKRLLQLEFQAQSTRSLLRDELAEQIGLTSEQKERLLALARVSTEAQQAVTAATAKNQPVESLQQVASKAVNDEQNALPQILKPEQQKKLVEAIGEVFDTASLQRIYPLAPEFVEVANWVNSKPVTLASLKGKVVLVHFYAFQCHNCHANFDIYKRWHRDLTNKGVVVIGIQTPELPAERDPNLVLGAAQEKGLDFPILVDLESKNWQAWGTTMWPTVYVIDQDGYLRFWWQGEMNWNGAKGDKTIETLVDSLLKKG